jgi:hypothetical protein
MLLSEVSLFSIRGYAVSATLSMCHRDLVNHRESKSR